MLLPIRTIIFPMLLCFTLIACTADLEPIVVTRVTATTVSTTTTPSPPPPATETTISPAISTPFNQDSAQVDDLLPAITPTFTLLTPTATTIITDSPNKVVLTWQQKSGRDLTYRCHEISITTLGRVTLNSCLYEEKETLLDTQLTAAQMEQLQAWHHQFQDFTTGSQNNPEGPDPWQKNFSFWGEGNTFVSDSQEGEIRVFAGNVMETTMSQWLDTAAPITEPPIFQGGDVRLLDWSPDGRYLAYFEYSEEQMAVSPSYPGAAEGTFTIYDTAAGTKCQDYPLSGKFAYEGPGLGRRHQWLPNGDLFVLTVPGNTFQVSLPCQEQAPPLFTKAFQNIPSISPDESTLVLAGTDSYWLYNWQTQTLWALDAEIPPSTYNTLAWSPDGRYLAITAVDFDNNATVSTWLVETAAGMIVAHHDWPAMTALDGVFGAPVWVNNEEVLIGVTQDREPFFMNVMGDIRSLLPLFLPATRDIPRAYVYINSNSYHILLTDFGSAIPPIQIYHSDTGEVETLDTTTNDIYLGLDGQIIADRNETGYLSRYITVVDTPLTRVGPQCYPDYSVSPIGYYADSTTAQRIRIWHIPDCSLVANLNLGQAMTDARYAHTLFSPDNNWLAVVPRDNMGRGSALFVLPLAEVLP